MSIRIFTRQTKRSEYHPEVVRFDFLDVEIPELEAMLRNSGFGPGGCDVTEVVNVQAIDEEQSEPKVTE